MDWKTCTRATSGVAVGKTIGRFNPRGFKQGSGDMAYKLLPCFIYYPSNSEALKIIFGNLVLRKYVCIVRVRALRDVGIALMRKTPIILTCMCELNMVFDMLGAWINAQIASI